MVVEYYLVSLLAVLVSRLDLECDSTSDGRVCQFKLLASLVLFSTFLRKLEKLTTGVEHQLNVSTVLNVLSALSLEIRPVVSHLTFLSLLKHAEARQELLVKRLVVFDRRGIASEL